MLVNHSHERLVALRLSERSALTANCGHDGQRKSVAHMPTAATTDAESHRSLISKQGTAALSTLAHPVRGPTHGGHLTIHQRSDDAMEA